MKNHSTVTACAPTTSSSKCSACLFQKIPTKHLHPTKSTFCYNYHWQQQKFVEGHHGCEFLTNRHSFSIAKTIRKLDVSFMVFHGKYTILDSFNPLSLSFYLSPKDMFTWLDIIVYMRAKERPLQINSPTLDASLPLEMISFSGFHTEQKLAGLWVPSEYSLLLESPVHHVTGYNNFVLHLQEYQEDTFYSNFSHLWPSLNLLAGSLLQSTLMVSFSTQNATDLFYKLVSTVGKLKAISLTVCKQNSTVTIYWLPPGQRTTRVKKAKKCYDKFPQGKSVSHLCFRFFLRTNQRSMQYTVLLRRSPQFMPRTGEMKKAETSWFEASDFCKSIGAFLPIMRDTQEYEEFLFILKRLKTPIIDAIYIGLQYLERNQVNFCMATHM